MTCDNPQCIGGYLFHGIGGMVFPTNRKCPDCNKPEALRELALSADGTIVFKESLEIDDKAPLDLDTSAASRSPSTTP